MPFEHWSRRKPPWWPENETWPPSGPPMRQEWHRMRGRFFRRIGCGLVFFFLFFLLSATFLFWLANSLSQVAPFRPEWAPVLRVAGILILVLSVVGVIFASLALRRAVKPVSNLLDAASHIEDGNYAARVQEDGPREVRTLGRAFNSMAASLQANDEQRRHLLADITHELRTPITVIQGNLEGILDGIYPPDQDHIQAILEETRLLARIIEDLRTLSLADAGAISLRKERIHLAILASDVINSIQSQADEARVKLKLVVQPDLPEVEADPIRMLEVLQNLLANALHYTSPGGEIELRVWGTNGADRKIWLSVRDSGAGISSADLPFIFDRFYKTADSRGSGLGLAISKGLVKSHGGDISAESVPGQNTTITFWLPIQNAQ